MNATPTLPMQQRIFLVVVDETEEMRVALRYAALRARHTGGRVALLVVLEPSELKQWAAVDALQRVLFP
ncbi:MAG TPA: universal stress protein, partial [Stellaceae bacterium]|nr:universal stress protein [Stellaceae bacterium]